MSELDEYEFLRRGETIYKEMIDWLEVTKDKDTLSPKDKERGLHLYNRSVSWLERFKNKRKSIRSSISNFLKKKDITRRIFRDTDNKIYFDEARHAIHEAIALRLMTSDERVVYMVDRTSTPDE